MTSLDDHRTSNTRTEIVKLAQKVRQVIVLSHSKPFLCDLWKERPKGDDSTALRINRAGNGSEIAIWDVQNDSITQHEKNHELVRAYLQASDPTKEREVAVALRPILEGFLRVAYPEHFPPGEILGSFIKECRKRTNKQDQILSKCDIGELDALREYANKFHHANDVEINDGELANFAERTLKFCSRR